MSDDADNSDERIELERLANIEKARKVIPLHERPVLGCEPCSGMTQSEALHRCGYFATCLADWERDKQVSDKQKGKN